MTKGVPPTGKKLKSFGKSPAKVDPKPKLKSFGTKSKKLRSFGIKVSDPRKRSLETAQEYAEKTSRDHATATKLEAKLFKIVDKLEAKRGTDRFDKAHAEWTAAMRDVDRTYINLHQAIVRERTVVREIETE